VLRPGARRDVKLILAVVLVMLLCQTRQEETVYHVTREYFDQNGNPVSITEAADGAKEPPPQEDGWENSSAPVYEEDVFSQAGAADAEPLMVNINTADAEELELLPEIDPAIAMRIIEYREAYGGFVAVEELMEVKGIGEVVYAKLEPYVTT